MELKGPIESILLGNARHILNPFNGIESNVCFERATRLECVLKNPFNGIERRLTNNYSSYPSERDRQNPFNGIERSNISIYSCGRMSIEYESIQWN